MNVVRHLSLGFVKLHCSIKYSALIIFFVLLKASILCPRFLFQSFFCQFFLNTLRCLLANNNWNLFEKKMQYFFFNPSFLDRKWTRKTTKFFQGFTMEKYNVIYSKLFGTSCTIFQISCILWVLFGHTGIYDNWKIHLKSDKKD